MARLYNFYVQDQCNYNGRMLYYGFFKGEKPCWHADMGEDILEDLVPVDEKAPTHQLVYRLRGRKGNTHRFTWQKIARTRVCPTESVIKKTSEKHTPR